MINLMIHLLNTLNTFIKMTKEENVEKAYNKWYNKIDALVYEELRMNLTDLPDEAYRDSFENELSPKDMAQMIINNMYSSIDFLFN